MVIAWLYVLGVLLLIYSCDVTRCGYTSRGVVIRCLHYDSVVISSMLKDGCVCVVISSIFDVFLMRVCFFLCVIILVLIFS